MTRHVRSFPGTLRQRFFQSPNFLVKSRVCSGEVYGVKVQNQVHAGPFPHIAADISFAFKNGPEVCKTLLARHLQRTELVNWLQYRECLCDNPHELFYRPTHAISDTFFSISWAPPEEAPPTSELSVRARYPVKYPFLPHWRGNWAGSAQHKVPFGCTPSENHTHFSKIPQKQAEILLTGWPGL